ncbi:hypothetical protein OYT1_ch1476 [Ferriphaselus amnicola]|uniref:Uncharacterized protein n=1 Tax=Ferriphaselus amnicola TaxID=1188319 RepID=A0A2Z6GC74_9PROT|nr:hypothetical protein [Ferriphaselus amnicola]BBE51030.1 hypothetical protein OYT1_ch1476 [Ferriphaselus amnicola]
MNASNINSLIADASATNMRVALELLFSPHANPVFGASKAVEHEVAAFNALKQLGYLTQSPDEFELVEKLRVTKAKARTLLYQAALREAGDANAGKQELRNILINPLLACDGDIYLIEVPHPLTMDRLRHRIRQLGHLSDGSFSGNVARIKRSALTDLIESLIPQEERAEVVTRLRGKGYQGIDFRSVVQAFLKKAGAKVAGEVGDEVAGNVGESISALFERTWGRLINA